MASYVLNVLSPAALKKKKEISATFTVKCMLSNILNGDYLENWIKEKEKWVGETFQNIRNQNKIILIP